MNLKTFIKRTLGIQKTSSSTPNMDELKKQFIQDFANERKRIELEIPNFDLEFKHIKNLQVLVNRNELLKKLKRQAVCAEIGVNEGDFSEFILATTDPYKLHLIDAWGDDQRYHDGLKNKVKERFAKDINSGKVELNVGLSTDILSTFPDNYFDWVYLDTAHIYSTTSAELRILNKKVKKDGFITGHDYILGNWAGGCRYGVIEAVHELCVLQNWQMRYLTINKNEMPSFGISRIDSL